MLLLVVAGCTIVECAINCNDMLVENEAFDIFGAGILPRLK
jgi:hypothetical protein